MGNGRGAITRSNIHQMLAAAFWFGLLIITSAFALSEFALRRPYRPAPEHVSAAGAEARGEGQRLSKLYGCTSCHGSSFQGLRYNEDPMLVRNYAPNLTLTSRRYSDEQLAQAIRQGVCPSDGRALWNMPSPTFSTITESELAAVLAYLRSFPPSGQPTPQEGPGIRARFAIVRGMLSPSEIAPADQAPPSIQWPAPELVAAARKHPPINAGREHAWGRHLASTICSECHGSDLGGDAIEGGPDLRIAAAYDRAAFRRLLRTGVPPDGRDLGLMSETAREDLKVLNDAEIDALHSYLVARAGKSFTKPAVRTR